MSAAERVAIVTGASRGIGRATALRLGRDFGAVALVARGEAGLGECAQLVHDSGAKALPVAIDLRRREAAGEVVAQVIGAFGRIDALVNIAGAVPQSDLFAMSDEEWDDGFALKFHGARRLAINAWDALRSAQGSVVFTSGTSAVAPKAALAAVGSINAAISAMAKAFAERGVADGVQVNSISPGPVMTDRRKSMLEKYAAGRDLALAEAAAAFEKEAGISRYGQPEDIAELVAFLVSRPARWMTGANVRMDGGELKVV